jgi:hypothetical protein
MRSLDEIREVKEAVEDELLRIPGVTGVDIGPKEVGGWPTETLAIRVLVAKKRPESDIGQDELIPRRIQDVPTDVIERSFEPAVLGVPADESGPGGLITAIAGPGVRADPLKGGLSIGPCRQVKGMFWVGTLGCLVWDVVTTRSLVISNYHVMALDGSWQSASRDIAQPSVLDGGFCPGADLVTWVSGPGGSRDPAAVLDRAFLNADVDCAAAFINRGGSCEIEGLGEIEGTAKAEPPHRSLQQDYWFSGTRVRKVGRTTKLTHGVVDTIDLTIEISYETDIPPSTFKRQIGVRVDRTFNNRFIGPGDSGSVLVNPKREVVGLLFAQANGGAYGVANRIQPVLQTLGVEMCINFW